MRLVDFGLDGKTILFLSSLRDERFLDIYEYELASGRTTRLWEASGALSVDAVSFDHQRFVVSETVSDADTNLYLVERGRPGTTLLTPHQGEVSFASNAFSRDGRTLYVTADEGSEFTNLLAIALDPLPKGGKPAARVVLKGAWDIEGAWVSWTGRYLVTVENADGTPRATVRRGEAGAVVTLAAPPPGAGFEPLGFSTSDRYLAVQLTSDTSPQVPWILDLERGTAAALDDALPESLRSRAMVVGESVRIPSFDGKEVPALLYRPPGAGPFPAVIDVHGGPTSQSRRAFARHRQYLASKGYVVLVPNVRGSTGYGRTWMRLDNKDLGGGPLRDILACKAFLVGQAQVDAARVAIMGGSYGGYMTLAAATFAPTEFAAHVDFFGVSDLKSLVESFPPYWSAYATFIHKKFGDPKDPADAAYQHDRSPGFFLDRVERPLLVVQGDKDPRVKKDQSDRVVESLRKRGVPVHYLVIPDEGHGFSKTENYQAALEATDRFLDRYLFGDTSRPVLPGP